MKRALVLVAALVASFACAPLNFGPSVPPSQCADLVARAITDPYNAHAGAAACLRVPGLTFSDGDFQVYASDFPPVFTNVDKACGYYPAHKAYVYVVHANGDGAAGLVVIDVDSHGYVTNARKHLSRLPGDSNKVACP